MKVKSLAKNQTEISTGTGLVIFISYETPVAALVPGRGFIRTDKKWSNTTTRHITLWLDGKEAQIVPQSELDDLLD